MSKKRPESSKQWMKEHFQDLYVQQSWKKKLRSRAWFKIEEIHRKDRIFKSGMTVLDLGSTPGGWSKYVLSQVGKNGKVIACDLLPMDAINGVDFIQGEIGSKEVTEAICKCVGSSTVQSIVSDMSPSISGMSTVDVTQSINLAELAFKMCQDMLAPGGSFLVKVFQGEGFDEYLQETKSFFKRVKIRKPNASRSRSREVYIVATGAKL